MKILIFFCICLVDCNEVKPMPESVKAMIAQDEELVANDVLGLPISPEELDASDQAEFSNGQVQLSKELFEGDILNGRPSHQEPPQQPAQPKPLIHHNAITSSLRRWPKAEVPYVISSAFSYNERLIIGKAIKNYQDKTCIRIRARKTSDTGYIHIFKGSGCYSMIGRQGGEQKVSIGSGCLNPVTVQHEIMHALGFWHEQSRIDRDNHIRINFGNIISGMSYNFEKYASNEASDLGAPYDLCSIMHYGPTAFSSNGRPTITVIKTGKCRLGQRSEFSEIDIQKLNTLYKCTGYPQVGSTMICTDVSDVSEDCAQWVDSYCKTGEYVGWMSKNCAKSCACSSPTTDSTCIDKRTDCSKWVDEHCKKGEWVVWMVENCAKSCACQTTTTTTKTTTTTTLPTTTPPTTMACEDKRNDCAQWFSPYNCRYHVDWMSENCAKSCACATYSTTNTACKDKDKNCAQWVAEHCKKGKYMGWMAKNCAKSCACATTTG